MMSREHQSAPRVALFIVAVMCCVHLQTFVAQANELEELEFVTFGAVNGECPDVAPPILTLQRGEWNDLCLQLSGVVEENIILDISLILSSEHHEHQLAQTQMVVKSGVETDAAFEFQVYVPADFDAYDNTYLSIQTVQTSIADETEISYSSVSIPVLLPEIGHDFTISLATTEHSVSQGSTLMVDGIALNSGATFGVIRTTIFDDGREILGQSLTQLSPQQGSTFSVLVDTSTLEIGTANLTLESSMNGSSDQPYSKQFSLVVGPASDEIEVHSTAWNESYTGLPVHPGQTIQVSTNVSNTGALSGVAEFILACDGFDSFNLSNFTEVLPQTNSEIDVRFTLPSSDDFGLLYCDFSHATYHDALPLRQFAPWPVHVALQLLELNSSFSEGAEQVELHSDDEQLFILGKVQNLGNGVEPLDWRIEASHRDNGQRIVLSSGRTTLAPSASQLFSYNGTFLTCDSVHWDIYFVVNDRVGEDHTLLVSNAFQTIRSMLDAEISHNSIGTLSTVQSGDSVPMTITVEALGQLSECSQNRTVQIGVGYDGTDYAVFEHQVTLRAGISSTIQVQIDTGQLPEATTYSIESRLLGNDTYSRNDDQYTINKLEFTLEIKEAVMELSCQTSPLINVSQTGIMCSISHDLGRNIPYKMTMSGDSISTQNLSGWLSPGETLENQLFVVFDRWGEHTVNITSSILHKGEYINQVDVEQLFIKAVHPLDGSDFIAGWDVSPDVPVPGQPVTITLDMVGTSRMNNGSLHLTMPNGGGGVDLQAKVNLESLEIGVMETITVMMNWPLDACENTYGIQLKAFNQQGIEMNTPDGIKKEIKRVSCPEVLPNLELQNTMILENGNLSVQVVNSGASGTVPFTTSVYLNGAFSEELAFPSLPAGANASVDFAPISEFSSLTIVVDQSFRVTESQDGSSNMYSFDMNYEFPTFAELDWNHDGELNSEERGFGYLADSDGDGLTDQIENEGWEVAYISHVDQLSALNEFLQEQNETPDDTPPPMISTRWVYPSSTSLDSDGDGLTDLGEFIQGTDPHDSDTDGDGLSDLFESEHNGQDPLMVELDAPVIEAIKPTVVGQPFLKTTYELFFTVDEPNLESIEVVIEKGSERAIIIPAPVSKLADGELEAATGQTYVVQYTLKDINLFSNVEVFVKTTDAFGMVHETSVANYSSLKSRVTTSLANFAMDLHPALKTASATVVGFIYSIFTVLQEAFDMVISIGKLIITLLFDFIDTVTGVAAAIGSLIDSFSFSAIKETVKKVGKSLWDMAMSLSPFIDDLSNNSFLGAFLIGYIALTLVVETMGPAAFKTIRALQKGEDGASLKSFFGHMTNSLVDMKNSAAKFAKNPLLTMGGWIKSLVSLPMKLLLGADFLASSVLLRASVSTANFKVIFPLIWKGYSWFGKKLDAPGAHRLSRGLDFMDVLQKSKRLEKIPDFEQKLGLRLARGVISDEQIFKQMNGFALLENGADIQKAHMKKFADVLFVNEAKNLNKMVSNSDGTLVQKHKFQWLSESRQRIEGTVAELSQVGYVRALDGSSVTTIAPGFCSHVQVVKKCGKSYDVDLLRIEKNPDGDIILMEIIDYKTYSKESGLRDNFAKHIKDRGLSIHDYQKQRFTENFLPDTAENRKMFVDFMAESNQISMADANLMYDFKRDWIGGLHDNVDVRYEAILHDGAGKIKQPKYLNGRSLATQKELTDCARCLELSPSQRDALVEDAFAAGYNRGPIKETADGFGQDLLKPNEVEPISQLMNDLYAKPVLNAQSVADQLATDEVYSRGSKSYITAMAFFSLAALIVAALIGITKLRGKRVRHG
jgi:hypothetical protein